MKNCLVGKNGEGGQGGPLSRIIAAPATLRCDRMYAIMRQKLCEYFGNCFYHKVAGSFCVDYLTHDGSGGTSLEIVMAREESPLYSQMINFFEDIMCCFSQRPIRNGSTCFPGY